MNSEEEREWLLGFLKEYANELKACFDWPSIGPVSEAISMPGRATGVKDESGDWIATFRTKGMPQHMPISSRDVALAKLLVLVVNALAGVEPKDSNNSD
jgi:hypothetical protein